MEVYYRAVPIWQGKKHRVQKHKHAGKGLNSDVFPAGLQTYDKPGGSKIMIRYDTDRMQEYEKLNGTILSFFGRRIGGVIFNQNRTNDKWAVKWTKIFGVQARVPSPMPEEIWALGENILCEGDPNSVIVVEEQRGRAPKDDEIDSKKGSTTWCRILPTIATLNQVEIKTGRKITGRLRWRVLPSPKTGEIWVNKTRLRRI